MLWGAVAVLAFAIAIAFFSWLLYPHVNLTIFNESSAAMGDVRIDYFYGSRTAERIEPGGIALAVFQIYGGGTVSMSYRDSAGVRRVELLYGAGEYSYMPRGSLEVPLTNKGTRLVDRTYMAFDVLAWTLPTWPTGRMTVR
jgi:hypothetical protein